MEGSATTLIGLGFIFVLGMTADFVGRRTRLPRVTLLLLFGFAVGPSAADVLPPDAEQWFPAISVMTLSVVAFLLGEKLSWAALRRHGRAVGAISLVVTGTTVVVVCVGLVLVGVPLAVALVLGAVATATAPAATVDVVRESKSDGPFSRILLGVVAIDDAWGLMVFSFAVAIAQGLVGASGDAAAVIVGGATEMGGGLAVGAAVGLPMAYLSRWIRPGEPTLVESLGLVFLCAGVALWADVSYLLACLVMGALVASFARHKHRPFDAIERVGWPLMVVFFILAGASLHVGPLADTAWIAAMYVVLRLVSRFLGGWWGAKAAHTDAVTRRWIGLALTPQAGVALGMALVAADRIPDLAPVVLPVVLGTTVVFEIVGPIMTRIALGRVAAQESNG